jgi:hypothetical protein
VRFVGGKLNSNVLEQVVREALRDCSEVLAIVAYCDSTRLFDLCKEAGKRVSFYGRLDYRVPVTSQVLNWFLYQCSPNYSCYLLRSGSAGGLHAKIIWLKGEGVYIGSANLTDRGWFDNIEGGLFLTEEELDDQDILNNIDALVETVHKSSTPISKEITEFVVELEKKRLRSRGDESEIWKWFSKNCRLPETPSVILASTSKEDDSRRTAFIQEWDETLQLLRNMAVRLRDYRPVWVDNGVPDGVHLDQFLHAYYYLRVREAPREPFDEHFERNRKDPEAALVKGMQWWQTGEYPHNRESQFIHEWAPSSRAFLTNDRIGELSETEFAQLCTQVHAIRDHAIKQDNTLLSLPNGSYSTDVKTRTFGKWLFRQRSRENKSVLETIHYVLYGGTHPNLASRLWNATHGAVWRIPHFSINSLGEIVGWAMPDVFPPRNSRTSKALRALGNPVRVY